MAKIDSERLVAAGQIDRKSLEIDAPDAASVIVAFVLMPDRTNDDLLGVTYFEQGHVARPAKRDDEFSHKGGIPHFSTAKRTVGQQLTGSLNRFDGSRWNVQVARWTVQFTCHNMIEQPLQVFNSLSTVDNLVCHADLAAFAAANLD
jgi:hypothetical protein